MIEFIETIRLIIQPIKSKICFRQPLCYRPVNKELFRLETGKPFNSKKCYKYGTGEIDETDIH